VTAVFVVIPLVCGAWALRVSGREVSTLTPVGLAVAAGLSLLTWAGYVVGPALLLAVALLPERFVDA
jgi:threonine/homoserine efflux transporter RhtA